MQRDWSRYWHCVDQPLEAMHAHFERHVYHRHSHETYSFGVTEDGAQAFSCRGWAYTSAAGMVMAFNPDDPHDGHAADDLGFTYRMVHIGPELVTGVLEDAAERRIGAPLFPEPVVRDRALAGTLRALHRGLAEGAPRLRRDELLTAAVGSIVRRAAASAGPPPPPDPPGDVARVAERVRELIHDAYLDDISVDDLASVAGRTRYAVYRAFRTAYGMAPSDYQRQLRLRAARRQLALGHPLAEVAARCGFADQSHLTRWFNRCYGLTPGAYRRATGRA